MVMEVLAKKIQYHIEVKTFMDCLTLEKGQIDFYRNNYKLTPSEFP
jgi:hypothetical protein